MGWFLGREPRGLRDWGVTSFFSFAVCFSSLRNQVYIASSFLSSAHFRTCFTDIRLPFPSHFRDVFSLPFCLFAVYLPREAEHESRSASTVGGSSGAGPSERRARIRLVCLSVCLSAWLTDSMNDASIDILLPTDLLLIVVFVDTRWLERSNCECRCRYHLFSVWCRETPVIASSVLILWIWCMMYSEQNYWFRFLSVPNNQLIVLCADIVHVRGERKQQVQRTVSGRGKLISAFNVFGIG